VFAWLYFNLPCKIIGAISAMYVHLFCAAFVAYPFDHEIYFLGYEGRRKVQCGYLIIGQTGGFATYFAVEMHVQIGIDGAMAILGTDGVFRNTRSIIYAVCNIVLYKSLKRTV
jgi:hypothetical protein